MRAKLHVVSAWKMSAMGVLFCSFLCFALLGLVSGWAEAAPGKSGTERAQEEARHLGLLFEQVRKEGNVRLLVELRVPFRPEGELEGPKAVLKQREQIGIVRRRVLERLLENAGFDRQTLKTFDTIPFFAVIVDEAGFWLLVRDQEVLSLREDSLSAPSGISGTSGTS